MSCLLVAVVSERACSQVHDEIGLPGREGRVQIARIHTAGMRQGGHLDCEVTADRIADHTENYAGAEIEGICRAAASFAFDRNVKVAGGHLSPDAAAAVRVGWLDFEAAMDVRLSPPPSLPY